ncbi:Mu-like prophage FluMu protein gp28 [Hoeflea phototrophica DFL-43]|jgi:phage FluMu gp28-like protein|uniref:Mu-like prophage FluMu protein gp28 n=1 Tax=Hoeflea phototrophica (strain DSM 17068 / NCIMB 14078 / DFL-43) TaxID=411684 RepID=A9D2W4_HOEPD|nr:terminase family protein [Hoeflea phototrophica]EDQ34286.1 Mu-like prophage FluMu protein gp28 [Hoeflea phototrophica DFL-43]
MSTPAVPLYSYQRKWMLDPARFKIGMFARQTGKTFTTTLEVVDDCFAAALASRRQRWVILSRGERQAREAMNEGVKLHAKAYDLAIEAHEYDWQGQEGSYRAMEVDLPHGSKITALPANPDTARGFSANVFLDEFAFHKDSGAIWKALFPVISAGWKLRITSTPNGKGNKFYELMTAEGDRWSKHEVDIYRAVADGLPRDIEELREGLADEDAWAQEYELKWLDEASAWLSYELISSVEDERAGDPYLYQGGPCYVGRDIGRRNDLHVIWVWELVGDVLWERERIEQKRATFASMDAAFDDVMERYRVVRACIDQTGMGEKVVEDAQTRHGSRIEGVLFTGPNKLVMATAGKEAFEDRRVRITMGDAKLRADLHKLRKVASATGAPRFVAERDDDHADRTWAAFLGIHAASEGRADYDYRPVTAATPSQQARRFDDPGEDEDFGRGWWTPPLGAGVRGGF